MKKLYSKLIALSMILVFSSLSFAPLTQAAGPSETPRVLSVNGEGKAAASASKAVINVSIENTASTARTAKMKNNEVLNKLRNSLQSYGVTKEDVKIEWSNTYKALGMGMMEKMPMPTMPAMDNSGNSYTANYSISIAVRDVKKASEIADYIAEMDNVNFMGTNYLLENNESATDKAREVAVQDARKKAEKLAKLYNVQLGKIANVSESSFTQPKNSYYGGGMPSQSSEMEVVVNLYVGYEMN